MGVYKKKERKKMDDSSITRPLSEGTTPDGNKPKNKYITIKKIVLIEPSMCKNIKDNIARFKDIYIDALKKLMSISRERCYEDSSFSELIITYDNLLFKEDQMLICGEFEIISLHDIIGEVVENINHSR